MTLPNKLTILRIVLTFVILYCLGLPGLPAKIVSFVLFVVASLTDWWDGYLARRSNQITPLGKLLDPIADKVLIVGVLLAFVRMGLVPGWMVLVIVIRELVVTGVRLDAARRKVVIAAAKEGKQKMVVQIFTIVLVFSLLVLREWLGGPDGWRDEPLMRRAILAGMWATMLLTVWSGATLFWRNRSVLHGPSG